MACSLARRPALFANTYNSPLLGEQLDLDRFAHFLPRQLQPFFLILLNLAPRCAQQVEPFPLGSAHLLEHFFGGNSPAHQPHPPRPSILRRSEERRVGKECRSRW